jgi:VRR-NUC domain-containing protein
MPPTPEQLASAGTEAAHQTALFCWAALPEQQTKYPELQLMFHIPNGGTRNKAEAGNLKAQGVKAGVPDIFLPVPKAWYAGLFIEMKVKPNKTSKQQDDYIDELIAQSYDTKICYSWIEAKDYIIGYLEQRII